ncbi:hypothetical protein GCM10027051_04680 [Niabella terrae]
MNRYRRDIILVINDASVAQDDIDMHLEYLHEVIAQVDNTDGFCQAHELVNRNRITANRQKILQAVSKEQLKPFRFLLNKN